MINSRKFQSFWIIEDLDENIKNNVARSLDRILPAFEIDETSPGVYEKGKDIQNGTPRERILCNFLAPVKLWATKEQCEAVINIAPRLYNPKPYNPLGEEIIPSEQMEGKYYYCIPFIRVLDVDDSLFEIRGDFRGNSPRNLDYPEKYVLEEDMIDFYFEPVSN